MCGPGQTFAFKVKAAICVLCSAVFFFGPTERAEATTVTNYLNYYGYYGWPQYNMAINVGDTVVWVNQWPTNSGTNYVESYGGEWKSPSLNPGDSFSFTFTNAEFLTYRTRGALGAVTVVAWTGAPPAVTINTPVDGSVTWSRRSLVQASVTNAEELAQIEYFANSDLIGTATNSPYAVWWGSATQAQYLLVAKATDRLGRVTWSPPVNLTGGHPSGCDVWGPRLLPKGELLFFYNADGTRGSGSLAASDTPLFPSTVCNFNHYAYSNLFWVGVPGVFVDESVRGGAVQRRFYTIIPGVSFCP